MMKENKSLIPVQPVPNVIIVERITIDSKLAKTQKEKLPSLQISKDQIAKMNKEKLDESRDILSVWDTHPLQATVIAIPDKLSQELKLVAGDRIAYRIDEHVGIMIVFNNKKYICLYAHDILFKYLTDSA